MTGYRSFLAALLVASAVVAPAMGQGFFTAKFSADQETHDVTSAATGTAVLEFREGRLNYFVTVEGLSGTITGAHFHLGEAGTSGGVVRGITSEFDGTTAIGTWTSSDTEPLTDELVRALFAGDLYLNVHTSANAAGEIRAQIIQSDGVTLTADLTPAQEVHDVTSSGRGTAIVQLSEAGASFFVSVDGLSGPINAAHFHNAEAGVNGGVVRGITNDFETDGTTAIGFWTSADGEPLTEDLLTDALKGNLYLNVHTTAYPAGELRGQLNLTSGWGFHASLDPAQEPGGSTGTGFGTAALTLTPGGLVYKITVTDLTGPITGAHFHSAPAGMNGSVVHGITEEFDGNTAAGIWGFDDVGGLTTELLGALLNEELYFNVHTTANPGGEIRGQVLRSTETPLAASLTPHQEQAGIVQDASGTAFLSLSAEGADYEITVDGLSGPITGAHFHEADMGANGGVVKNIGPSLSGNHAAGSWTTSDASQPLTNELRTALLLGRLYLNVHTDANPGGEVRGQVLVSGGTAIRSRLTSDQQLAAVTQDADGTAAMVLTKAGLIYQVTVEGLSGAITNAHFHDAPIGVNGGVVHGILSDFDGNTASGFWPTGDPSLSPELRDALLAGDLYLNVHTVANGGGELRGQTQIASGIGSGVELSAGQEVGAPVTSDGRGTASVNLSAEGVTYDITVDGLTGDISGAHFHNAALGTNGGVVRDITTSFLGKTAFGVWRDSDGQAFSIDNFNEFVSGNMYLNIHTVANQSGEIRGQIGVGELVATAVEQVDDQVPSAFRLSQNYPNPFNPSTTIDFDLTRTTAVNLTVYNVIGQQVRTLVNNQLAAGTYRVHFDAQSLPSGIYTYTLATGKESQTRKMLLVK